MPDSNVSVQDAGNAKVDTEAITRGADTVHRQRVQVAGSDEEAVAEVKNTVPGVNDYGLVTRALVGNFPASQAVTGPLTDTELRATPVPVSGPLTDAQLRSTPLAVSGLLTDVQLRASSVPVSGPLTDTELRATPIPMLVPLPYSEIRSSGATRTTVSAVASDTLLLASNPLRRGLIIKNDAESASLHVGFGTAAVSATNFSVDIGPGGYYETPYGFTGEVRGIWTSAAGAARLTEFT